jgi:hypothetical protein
VTTVPKDFSAGDGNRDWETTVMDSVRKVTSIFTLEKPGEHTLKFWMVDPGIVLQKIVVNLGGVKPSYLGPPESFFEAPNSKHQAPEKHKFQIQIDGGI